MTDSFTPTLSTARRLLADKGPITPDKVRAADMYASMNRLEPTWPWWLLADLVAATAVLTAPLGYARATAAAYALLYALSTFRDSRHNDGPVLILAEANPDRFAASNINIRVVGSVTAVVILALGTAAVLVPEPALRITSVVLALFVVRHTYRRVAAHLRSARVLAQAPSFEWFPVYAADRELRAAAALVAARPGI